MCSSDLHGEGLGEHTQIFEHNGEIYDEVMRVPLIVRRPDPSARGERVTALVRTLDVAPTVLEWLALPPEPGMQGQSLLAFTAEEEEIRAAAEGPGEILLEALRDRQVNPVELSLLGLRGEGFKAILALDRAGEVKKVELFDLRQDPHENVDLAPEQPERAKTLRARILALEQSLPRPQQSNVRELGALESDALRALGYGR